VLLAQPPVPVDAGSLYVLPVAGSVYVPPAWTVPVPGAPASVDWQLVRSPPNEYVNGCDVVLRPGVNDAVPLSWDPPVAADAPGAEKSGPYPACAKPN
jgi:hypothetical protein